jgi:hypothetical protein
MASPGVREPHMPPAAYVQLASADVSRARATLRAAAAAYLTADVNYTSAGEPMPIMPAAAEAEERLLGAASELRYVRHVHEQHVKQPQAPIRCSSCQRLLSQVEMDVKWGVCASCFL